MAVFNTYTNPGLIGFLWRYGHFWGPENPDGLNVIEADLPALTVTDSVVRAAIQSYQNADANHEQVATIHGHTFEADGLANSIVRAVSSLARCPMPDHIPPPGVRVKTADPGLDAAIESMQEWAAAGGTGSWPASGCDPQRRGVHSIRVRINPSRAPSGVRGYMEQALAAASAAFGEMGLAVRYILDANSDAEIEKEFTNLAGGTIGWNYFPRPNTCNTITGKLDTGYSPSDWRMWANLETHESGHGCGLEHTRGSIMNPSILLVWPLTWKGTPSEAAMRRYFGGEPVPGPTPVPPTPVPPVPGPPWPTDPPPVGPPVPVPTAGKIVLDLDKRTVSLPPGWRLG